MNINWISLIPGLLLCLFGWTIYWMGIQITGSVIGLFIGVGTGLFLSLLLHSNQITTYVFLGIGGTIGLLLGLFLSRAFHYWLFFLLGTVIGGIVAFLTLPLIKSNHLWNISSEEVEIIYYIIVSVSLGILSLLLSKYIVILLCSFCGTVLILYSFNFQYAILLFLPILTLSLLVQVHFFRKILPSPAHGSEK